MPGLNEVRVYLSGLWLLIRGEAAGLKRLDISDRGLMRSFWAILWCLPAMTVSWLWWRALYLRGMPQDTELGGIFFFRLAMLELANWLVPLILIGFMAWGLALGRKYYAIVVAVNWLSVPFAYAYAVLSLLLMLAPNLNGILSLIWLMLMIALIVSVSRIFRVICGQHPLMVATLTMVLIVPTMLLSDSLERFLGIYPG
ncbi:hypothetical protein [Pseudorhizobium pelagicum]|uniref:Membrane protein n=1 Tax=Pseudorhizobium pelagicum TaxID=1509405 RepID=A0A922NWY4_9HYPH|nr:hypothetical protein [Pseudorhizobium pelagicum]KEQ03898.1 membrane protein [Pseudorhizobium pelagicum]KEQ04618.1 membrane protein [Pseudorhizobium pelagicum]